MMLSTVRSSDLTGEYALFSAMANCVRRRSDHSQPDPSARCCAVVAVVEAQKYLVTLRSIVLQAADSFRIGDLAQANLNLVEVVWGVEWILKAGQAIEMVFDLDFAQLEINGKKFAILLDDLRLTLNEIHASHKQGLSEALGDLLEYELAPHLELARNAFATVDNLVAASKDNAIHED